MKFNFNFEFKDNKMIDLKFWEELSKDNKEKNKN